MARDPNPILAKRQLDEETLAAYEELKAALLQSLREIKVSIAHLRKQVGPRHAQVIKQSVKLAEPTPIIEGVREFLRMRGEPSYQSEIIEAVGSARAEKYPKLLRPYGDVWKSLQYHDRADEDIVCVEWNSVHLIRGKLQGRPRAPITPGGKTDSPAYYREPNNLFWFKAEIGMKRR
jgi:hypothetical protein